MDGKEVMVGLGHGIRRLDVAVYDSDVSGSLSWSVIQRDVMVLEKGQILFNVMEHGSFQGKDSAS